MNAPGIGLSAQIPRHSSTVAALIAEARRNPLRWLVPGIVIEGGQHVLHGREETFKTMVTLQLHEALATGGEFLGRPVNGKYRTGIVQLETKLNIFGSRLSRFFGNDAPPIEVFPSTLRLAVLNGKQPKDRIGIIAAWAKEYNLSFVSIDSAVKLFPSNCDLSRPEQASEIFNQLQLLPTIWMLAHDRKMAQGFGDQLGNQEIVGSGRFAQDPDIVHQMIRPDGRAPRVIFNWGKVRDGEKSDPLELWFDKLDFRLYPIHPYIHLLRPGARFEEEIVQEAEQRYGWKERRAREFIATLKKLCTCDDVAAISERQEGHKKLLEMIGEPLPAAIDLPDGLIGPTT